MSHVDEGTLHAYLDGELAPVERERVDAHLKGCPACQARLADERAIIERASRLLGMATPPERAMPPLQQLRQPRLAWRLRRPLAWAATLILAVGLGWYARGTFFETSAAVQADDTGRALAASPQADELRPQAHPSLRRLQHQSDSVAKDRDERQLAAGRATAASGNAAQTRESAAVATGTLVEAKTDAVAQLPATPPAGVTVRGDRAAPKAAAEPQPRPATAPAAEFGQAQSGVITIDGAPARARRAAAIMSTTWPIIARQPARDVLGVDPVVIPGFAVRAYRRNPVGREIVVEQVTDAGTPISLIERRLDGSQQELYADSAAVNAPRAMAKAINERLARFVGPLRIEIDGPLTPDSLSSLLELAR